MKQRGYKMAKARVHVIHQDEKGKILISELTDKGYKLYDNPESGFAADDGEWEDWKTAESAKRLLNLLGLDSK